MITARGFGAAASTSVAGRETVKVPAAIPATKRAANPAVAR
jgi:hypothetical protein